MKSVLVVLSAAVVTALAVYFAFSACGAFGLMQTSVVIDVEIFIAFITALTILSALLAVSLRAALARSDERLLRKFEQRLVDVERAGRVAESAVPD